MEARNIFAFVMLPTLFSLLIACTNTHYNTDNQPEIEAMSTEEQKTILIERIEPDNPHYAKLISVAKEAFANSDYIQSAPEKLKDYVVKPTVIKRQGVYGVTFVHKDTPKRYKGSLPGKPNFSVKIDSKTLKVVKVTRNK